MQTLDLMFQLPTDLEMWIVVCYVIVVLIGARITELLAQMHFNLAHRQAEQGFQYIADADHYRCPEGEKLIRMGVEPSQQLAIYEAAPDRCRTCASKSDCVPQAASRRLYRSLVSWAQTDTGRFHRRVSMLMFGAAAVLALVGTWQWSGSPGTGYLLISLVASSISLAWDMPFARKAGPATDCSRAAESPDKPAGDVPIYGAGAAPAAVPPAVYQAQKMNRKTLTSWQDRVKNLR